MARCLVVASFVLAGGGLAGCGMLLGHRKGAAFDAAVAIDNPVRSGRVERNAVAGIDGTTYALASYAPDRACFSLEKSMSPAQVPTLRFTLAAYATRDDAPAAAALIANEPVRLVASAAYQEAREGTATDTIRDGRGEVIATQTRNVTKYDTRHMNRIEVCFPRPEAAFSRRFLVLHTANDPSYGEQLYAVWELR